MAFASDIPHIHVREDVVGVPDFEEDYLDSEIHRFGTRVATPTWGYHEVHDAPTVIDGEEEEVYHSSSPISSPIRTGRAISGAGATIVGTPRAHHYHHEDIFNAKRQTNGPESTYQDHFRSPSAQADPNRTVRNPRAGQRPATSGGSGYEHYDRTISYASPGYTSYSSGIPMTTVPMASTAYASSSYATTSGTHRIPWGARQNGLASSVYHVPVGSSSSGFAGTVHDRIDWGSPVDIDDYIDGPDIIDRSFDSPRTYGTHRIPLGARPNSRASSVYHVTVGSSG